MTAGFRRNLNDILVLQGWYEAYIDSYRRFGTTYRSKGNNNNLLTASGLSTGGSGYFTFKLRQTY
jgi:hypothetical protein